MYGLLCTFYVDHGQIVIHSVLFILFKQIVLDRSSYCTHYVHTVVSLYCSYKIGIQFQDVLLYVPSHERTY